MNGREFFDNVVGHEDLTWLGVREAVPATRADLASGRSSERAQPDRVYIANDKAETIYEIAIKSIVGQPWSELLAVIIGKRSPNIMTGITRIVGYYSFVRNWNGSKLAELADRHRGQYSVPAKIEMKCGYTPDEADLVSHVGSGELACKAS